MCVCVVGCIVTCLCVCSVCVFPSIGFITASGLYPGSIKCESDNALGINQWTKRKIIKKCSTVQQFYWIIISGETCVVFCISRSLPREFFV